MPKVTGINRGIIFDDGSNLYDYHDQDCCENHYLSYADITLSDFDGLDFDLSSDSFFERVPAYGIRLVATNGATVSIPGYGYNNGYYSSNLTLILSRPNEPDRKFNITECQDQRGS